MKKSRRISSDLATAKPAMVRAARNARKLAEATGTPFYVWQDGKVANLNPVKRKTRKSA